MLQLTKDAKYFGKLWSTWLYVILIIVTGLEGISQFVELALPHWEGLMTPTQYMIFVAVTSTIQTASRFIKQNKLIEEISNDQKSD